jgi:hypothetical protein
MGIAVGILALAIIVSPMRFARYMPNSALQWTKAVALFISAWTLYSIPLVTAFSRFHRTIDLRRRAFLKGATGAALVAPVVVGAVAFIRRDNLRVVEIEIPVAGLPKDLHGLRIVQLSDIHLSPFLSEATLERGDRHGERNEAESRPCHWRSDQPRGRPARRLPATCQQAPFRRGDIRM